ncbi:SusC/RagA family TonB-linked outer membrane protein [Fulvitalea axinellae]|uniref:SusC/RagA family TonB-linked outer membrane protein n=1 Tax=Fulvitalea axinellae TaxID=1182444 RepID=A0AAU9CBG0_9BACT|nr:SusC/RagA family TonB-linked outer membrane protein [Fulvitalea axinellae]
MNDFYKISFAYWRKTGILLSFIILLLPPLAAGAVDSGNVVKLKFENERLEVILAEIGKQTSKKILFRDSDLAPYVKVSVQGEYRLQEALECALSNSDLSFEVVKNQIIIKKKVREAVKTSLLLQDKKRMVNGRVVSASEKDGLPGVNVVIKGTSQGVITDVAGNFSIELPDNADNVLVFTSVGFKKQEVRIGNQTTVEVTLDEDLSELEEVVVVGYGVQKKANLTGATTTVKMNDVLGSRPLNRAAEALQGAVPGLQITMNSGQPGATGQSINIRGMTSINGGEPLVLADNVPVNINDINPNDIESVTVLKDAAASSIYGARAAFGVILITTKKSSTEKVRFSYSNSFGVSSPVELPKAASPIEFIGALKDWGVDTYWSQGQDIAKWHDLIGEYNANPSKYPEGFTEVGGIRYQLAGSDVMDEFLNDSGFKQIHNFSIDGGNGKTNYRVSVGYTDDDGIMVSNRDRMKRYNLSTYLGTKILDNLTAETRLFYVNTETTFPDANYSGAVRQGITIYPTGNHKMDDGSELPYGTPANQVLNSAPNERSNGNIRLFGSLKYEPIKDLAITGEYTYENKAMDQIFINDDPVFVSPSQFTKIGGVKNNTSYSKQFSVNRYHAVNVYANYSKQLFGAHNISLTAGYNYEKTAYEQVWAKKMALINTDLPSLSGASGTLTAGDGFHEWAVMGSFARFNYNYKERYFLEANGRYDGSSRFPKGERYGFFPSVSAGWNITNETFMASQKIFDLLKVRASWGNVGNQIVKQGGTQLYYPAIPGMPTYKTSWVSPNNNEKFLTLAPPALVSSNFTWEQVRTINYGLDVAAFKNKLTANFDWFTRTTYDMIAMGAELPAVLGTSAPRANVADLKSYGWELSLGWRQSIGDWSYSLGFNLSDNRAEITKFDNEEGLLSQNYEGKMIGEIWGYETDGFYSVDDFVDGSLKDNLTGGKLKEGVVKFKGVNPNPGDIKYKDLNGDGEINWGNETLDDPGDKKVIGNNHRRFQYGINASVGWKNFDLSVFVQGVGKRDLWVSNDMMWAYRTQFDNVWAHQLDYWTPENTDAYYMRNYAFSSANYKNGQKKQTKYLQDGAYWNLKNVTLGYSLPEAVIEKLRLSSFRVYFSGENMFVNDQMPEGMNPEFKDKGMGNAYPFMKQYTVGLNVSF